LSKIYSKIVVLSISGIALSILLVPVIETKLGLLQYEKLRQITGLISVISALHFGYYDGIIAEFYKKNKLETGKYDSILMLVYALVISFIFYMVTEINWIASFIISFSAIHGSKVAVLFSVNIKDYYVSYVNVVSLLVVLILSNYFEEVVQILLFAQIISMLIRFGLTSNCEINYEGGTQTILYYVSKGRSIYVSGFVLLLLLNYERIIVPFFEQSSPNFSISNTLSTALLGVFSILGNRLYLDLNESSINKLKSYVIKFNVLSLLGIGYIYFNGGYVDILGYRIIYGPLLIVTYGLEFILLWLPILRRNNDSKVFLFIGLMLVGNGVIAVCLGEYSFVFLTFLIRSLMTVLSYCYVRTLFVNNFLMLSLMSILIILTVLCLE